RAAPELGEELVRNVIRFGLGLGLQLERLAQLAERRRAIAYGECDHKPPKRREHRRRAWRRPLCVESCYHPEGADKCQRQSRATGPDPGAKQLTASPVFFPPEQEPGGAERPGADLEIPPVGAPARTYSHASAADARGERGEPLERRPPALA